MATHSFGTTALPGTVTDVAEMADGTLWIGRYGSAVGDGTYNAPDYPFYMVAAPSGLARTHVASLGRMQLRRLAGNAVDAAGPSDAGAICGVVQILPEGYALALAADELQVWRYSAATWTVAAVRTLARVGTNAAGSRAAWRLTYADGEVYACRAYTFMSYPDSCYVLRGSSLQQIGGTSADLRLSSVVGLTVSSYFATLSDNVTSETHAVARWRGRWWTERDSTTEWHGFAYHDGQQLVWRAGWDNPTRNLTSAMGYSWDVPVSIACLAGDRFALHAFGSRNAAATSDTPHYALTSAYGAWCQYDNGQALTRDDLTVSIHAGRERDGGLWLLGHDITEVTESSMGLPDRTYYTEGTTSKLYAVGLAATADGVVVTGCTDSTMDGWYYVDGTYNGHTLYVHEDGDYWIIWDPGSGHWVIVAADDPTTVLETDGTGATPWVWPAEEAAGPGAGEGILFVTHTDADKDAVGVRVTTGEGLTTEAGYRAIVRCGDDTDSVTDYTTYKALPLGHGQELDAGATVRVGIIGSTAADPPDVQVVTRRVGA